MRYAWDIVIRLRPTIFVAGLAILVLAVSSQMLELFLIDIETVQAQAARSGSSSDLWTNLVALRPILTAAAGGLFAVIVLWLCNIHLVRLDPQRNERPQVYVAVGYVLIVIVAVAPILGVLGAFNSILLNVEHIAPGTADQLKPEVVTCLKWSGALLLLTTAVLSLATVLAFDWLGFLADQLFTRWGAAAGTLAIALLTAILTVSPTHVAWVLGTLALVYIFLGVLAFVLTLFSHIYRRTGWPVTVLVVAAAVAMSLAGINDNHRVELAPRNGHQADLYDSYLAWIAERKDRSYYNDRQLPYPIYIISAEGGGLYAAYHSATFLATVQDQCPLFAQHIFGLSSVSGGSLGSAVFASLASQRANNTEWQPCLTGSSSSPFMQATKQFFATDFLAPLVGATLFPDLIQKLIPTPIFAFDRAKALERTFEAAWEKTVPPDSRGEAHGNLFSEPLSSLWSPKGASPALFLNVTSVATGARITINPMTWASTPTAVPFVPPYCGYEGEKEVDIPLSAAVSLSAAFPWLMPAGWIERLPPANPAVKCPPLRGDRIVLVDGGYLENSGLELASELTSRLRVVASTRKDLLPYGVEIRLIAIIAKDEFAVRWWSEDADLAQGSSGEILTPISVMLRTRQARTRAVHSRMLHFDDAQFNLGERYFHAPGVGWTRDPGRITWQRTNLHNVVLDGTKFFLPLGWHLSQTARRHIEAQSSKDTQHSIMLIRGELMGEPTPVENR